MLLLAVALTQHAPSRAESSGGAYALPSETIAAGGGRSTGGPFALDGTVAQHAIGPPATGGAFELIPGFRRERATSADFLFKDGFEDN
jgi:hypothetical protein